LWPRGGVSKHRGAIRGINFQAAASDRDRIDHRAAPAGGGFPMKSQRRFPVTEKEHQLAAPEGNFEPPVTK